MTTDENNNQNQSDADDQQQTPTEAGNVVDLSTDARELRQAPQEAVEVDLGSDLDPAQRALADALRLSFRILQGVMVILIIGFLLTGFSSVREQEQGLRITFGKMQSGEPLTSGAHASWPAPAGEFIHVITAPQVVPINDAFWIALKGDERSIPFEQLSRRSNQGLVPGEDGSVITSDHNLAHTRWRVVYRINDARTFIKNIAESEHVATTGSEADLIVRKAIERGVVHASAETKLDDVISSRDAYASRVRSSAQQMLDGIGTGIMIDSVSCVEAEPPRSILEDYQAVNKAASDANQNIEQAREEATQTLNGVAGAAYRKLEMMIRIYEALSENVEPDPADVDQLCKIVDNPDEIRVAAENADDFLVQIDRVLISPQVGGSVADIIADSRQYSTGLLSKVEAETHELEAYYKEYQKNPMLMKNALWRNAVEKMYHQTNERFILNPNTKLIELRINRDPKFRQKINRMRNQRELESAQSGG